MSVNEKMTALADAIREKSGVTGKLTIDGMTSAVKAISSLIVASASGNPIVLNDSTDLRVQSLRLFGKTTQNGTPTPEAPVPLVSAGNGGSLGVTVAGKNLLDLRRFVSTEDISATIEGDSVTLASKVYDWYKGYYLAITLEPNAKYTVSAYASSNGKSPFRFIAVKINGVNVGQNQNLQSDGVLSVTFTTDSGGEVNLAFGTNYEAGQQEVTYSNIQLEYGATVTEYEPYKESQTIPISTPNGLPGIPVTSGGNYTDETGQQWVCDEVDFGRGVYVQRVQHNIYCGNDEEAWYIADVTNNVYEELKKTGNAATVTETTGILPAISNKYISVSRNTIYTSTVTSGISNSAITKCIRVKDNRFTGTTSGEWAAWIAENPFEVIYKLATPNETPLSEIDPDALAQYATLHTNYPNTTILNDGGAGMEVNYVADTKLYIDNKINAMAAAIVNA